MLRDDIETHHGTMGVRRWPGVGPSVVCLHGFSLHGGMFAGLAAELEHEVIAPDLPGHGESRIAPVDLATTLSALEALVERAADPQPVLGYSQGGRLALHLARRAPHLVSQLILVSTSVGLRGTARVERLRTDMELADRIEHIGIDRFLDEWLAQPLVDTRRAGPEAAASDRALRLESTAAGLAAALRGLGQGSVPYVDPASVPAPITWVAGSLDERYSADARGHGEAGHGAVRVIPRAGHNVVLEAPSALARIVTEALSYDSWPRR